VRNVAAYAESSSLRLMKLGHYRPYHMTIVRPCRTLWPPAPRRPVNPWS